MGYLKLFGILLFFTAFGQNSWTEVQLEQKIDSLFNNLSLEAKVSMLFAVKVNGAGVEKHRSGQMPFFTLVEDIIPAEKSSIAIFDGFGKNDFPSFNQLNAITDNATIDYFSQVLNGYLRNRGIEGFVKYRLGDDGFGESDFVDPDEIPLKYCCFKFNKFDPLLFSVFNFPDEIQKTKELFSLSNSVTDSFFLKREWGKMLDVESKMSFEEILSQKGLVFSSNFPEDYEKVLRSFKSKFLPEELLEGVCRKVLALKVFLESDSIRAFSDYSLDAAITKVYQKGAVLIKNHNNVLPLKGIASKKVVSMFIGKEKNSSFQRVIENYGSCESVFFSSGSVGDLLISEIKRVVQSDVLFLGIDTDGYSKNELTGLLEALGAGVSSVKVVLVLYGDLSNLSLIPDSLLDASLIWVGDHTNKAQEAVGHLIYGGIGANGVLPWRVSEEFPGGEGVSTSATRLRFGKPMEVGIHPDSLSKIEEVVDEAIKVKATPGCQVLVARKGVVVYQKSFGYHTYNKRRAVENSHLYDVASVTKIAATLPVLMRMYEEGKWALSDTLGKFISGIDSPGKGGFMMKDILGHQAGLESFVPFYLDAIDKEKLHGNIFSRRYTHLYNIKLDSYLYLNKTVKYKKSVFNRHQDEAFSIRVTPQLFMNRAYVDSIYFSIDNSKIGQPGKYVYSDLGYYYFKRIIEDAYGTTLDQVVGQQLLLPLGTQRSCYNAIDHYPMDEIVPTENDLVFRKTVVHGTVHDPGAAMLGGVGGHAGLFSTAGDLAIVLQMFLNGGSYGGDTIVSSETIRLFTAKHFKDSRRGLGFDKPEMNQQKISPVCPSASAVSFGHSGFTGALVWVDPKYELVYVFLSNRVYPRQFNKKLIKLDIRTRIQEQIYRSINE